MAPSPFLIHRTTSSCVCNQQRTSLPPPTPPTPPHPPPNKFLTHRTTSSCVCNQQRTSLPPPTPPPHPTRLQTNFSSTEQHHLVFAINNERHYPPPTPQQSNFFITEDEWIWPKHWQERVENAIRPLFSSCVQNTNIISCGRRERKHTFHPKESRNAFRVAGVGENRH